MLCRRMHLNERRVPPPRLDLPMDRPVLRPCSFRGDRAAAEAHLHHIVSKSQKLLEKDIKTPLVIVNLDISDEAKTLVQKDVKKDPKKNPPFCKLYQSGSKHSLFSDARHKLPQFFIKGVMFSGKKRASIGDITDTRNQDPASDSYSESDADDYSEEETSVPDNSDEDDNNNNNKFDLTDSFAMDKDGFMPFGGLTRTPTPHCLPVIHAPPSPNTRQIIRVDVTVNRDRQDVDRFTRPTSSRLRDKRTHFKFSNAYL